ncbi:PKD domain-containing protein [Kitasatospora sp. NPDC048239]|uniref:PKD domain-containing protein n=1 Tax=Kitasatospora sp. NPDC048239 TaxID=3364046 RepID=UPI003716FFAA
MRLRHVAGLSAAVVSAVVGLPLPAVAATPAPVLYVDNQLGHGCDEHGTGTAATPYCTIQTAADAAQPGQTVQVAPYGEYFDDLVITRSGEPGKPIIIRGAPMTGLSDYSQSAIVPSSKRPIRLSNVHDVVLTGFDLDPVEVVGSARVELSRNWFENPALGSTVTTPAVAVSGSSEQVTIAQSVFYNTRGLSVGAGSKQTAVVGNQFSRTMSGTAIDVTDAPGTTITNNTLTDGSTSGLALNGASTGSAVYNNIVNESTVTVSAGSATGTTLDYNIAHPVSGLPAYSWAGAGYRTPAELLAATGQGTHDTDIAVAFDNAFLPLAVPAQSSGRAAIDSADPQAPGVIGQDLLGNPAADHPSVANSGPNGTFRDRGAYEVRGLLAVDLRVVGTVHEYPGGPAPLTVDLTADATNRWDTTLTYTFDFGDGTAPVSGASKTVRHTYTAIGDFHPKVTVTDGRGGSVTTTYSQPVQVGEDKPLGAALTVTQESDRDPLAVSARVATSGPYRIASYSFDFGDGPAKPNEGYQVERHVYAKPGTYTVKVTVTDDNGASATSTQQVTVAYTPAGFTAIAPTRILDTRAVGSRYPRLGGGDTMELYVRGRTWGATDVVPPGATAVVLNLTATQGTAASHLDVYPAGGERPITSNVNFTAGQDVSNLVTVPIGPDGKVVIRNNAGQVHTIADVLGYYKADAPGGFTSLAPARLLDTRSAGGPIGETATRRLKVAGSGGVPANATSVVLNVTATESTATSFFTVFPAGTQRPSAGSNLNTVPNRNIPNQVIVPLGADGSIDIYNHNGSSHAIVDVFGYFSPDGQGLFTPVTPARLLDSRNGNPLGGGSVRTVGGVPAGATAAAVNLTATQTTEATHLTAWATGSAKPGTSNLNATAGLDVPNHTTIPVDAAGRFDIANNSGSTHVIADLFGYYRNK